VVGDSDPDGLPVGVPDPFGHDDTRHGHERQRPGPVTTGDRQGLALDDGHLDGLADVGHEHTHRFVVGATLDLEEQLDGFGIVGIDSQPVDGVGGDPDKLNSSLDRVARTVNIYGSAGVPASHLHFVVVIHGPATPIVLDSTHYQEKFKFDNPNIALIDELEKVGVKVVVCGQALAHNKFAQEWVYPKIELTLSAITDIIILEKSGYVLFPL